MYLLVTSILFMASLPDCQATVKTWGYTEVPGGEPANWHKRQATCGGKKQSPIDIVTKDVSAGSALKPFEWKGYDTEVAGGLKVNNNGHTMVFEPQDSLKASISAGGLPLDGEWKLLQFHLHWGAADNDKGSEHTVNGKAYPAELHLVHQDQAKEKLAVVGVFIEETKDTNAEFQKLVSKVADIKYAGSTQVEVPALKLESLLPKNRDAYYRYQGSLTTPDCSEIVTWTLLQDPIGVTKQQLKDLQSLSFDETGQAFQAMTNNFRPVQALNGRKVTSHAVDSKDSPTSESHGAVLYASVSTVFLAIIAAVYGCYI